MKKGELNNENADSNIKLINNNGIPIKINSKIFPKEIVISAAYVLIEKAYFIIEGEPEKEINVIIHPKNNFTKDEIEKRFNKELLNFSAYEILSKKNQKIRQSIIKRILLTNKYSNKEPEEENKNHAEEIDDPEGIMIPWEEKYGKESKKDSTSK